MNAPANLPAERREQPPLAKLANQLDQRATEFKKALPSHISPDKLQRTIITAAQNNPDLLTADRQSLITSCMKAAQDGLLPDGREAALVIFNTREKGADGQWYSRKLCQYMPMVYGLRKKIVQSGEIVSLQTGLVYRAEMEAGAFLYEVGLEPPIRHRPMLDLPADELTDDKIVAAYSMAKMKDGTVSVEVMRRGEIDKVREASNTGATRDKKGNPRQPKGPWVDWFGEMARKTVMRRHSKTLPMSGDVLLDIEGQEQEREAAESVMGTLSIEPDAPVALPSTDDLDAQAGETIDAATGEVTTGFTEVDEETARALDADHGNPTAPEPEEEQDETPAWAAKVEWLRKGIPTAKNKNGLKEFKGEFDLIRPGLPDEVVAELDALHEARLAALPKPKPAPEPEPQAEQASSGWAEEAPNDGTLAEDNPTAAEGPADEQRGEPEAQPEVEPQPIWVAASQLASQKIAAATDRKTWLSAEDNFIKIAGGLPDEVRERLDRELIAKRNALQAAGA